MSDNETGKDKTRGGMRDYFAGRLAADEENKRETASQAGPVTPSFLINEENGEREAHEPKREPFASQSYEDFLLSYLDKKSEEDKAGTEAPSHKPEPAPAPLKPVASPFDAAAFDRETAAGKDNFAGQKDFYGTRQTAGAAGAGTRTEEKAEMKFGHFNKKPEETPQGRPEAAPAAGAAEKRDEPVITAVKPTPPEPAPVPREEKKAAAPEESPKKDKAGIRGKLEYAGNKISRAWRVAGMVLASLLVIFAVIGIIASVSFIKSAFGKMDTPKEAGQTLVSLLKKDDFKSYQKLLAGQEPTANDKATFESLRSSLDNSKDIIVSNFILIRLENGRQFLCSIYFDDARGEYVFRSVQEVPLGMQNLFTAK